MNSSSLYPSAANYFWVLMKYTHIVLRKEPPYKINFQEAQQDGWRESSRARPSAWTLPLTSAHTTKHLWKNPKSGKRSYYLVLAYIKERSTEEGRTDSPAPSVPSPPSSPGRAVLVHWGERSCIPWGGRSEVITGLCVETQGHSRTGKESTGQNSVAAHRGST